MINYIKREVGIMQSNAYFVYNENRECVVIDCGGSYSEMMDIVEENKLCPKAVILTHGHYDHIAGAKGFQDNGIPVLIHERDAEMLCSENNLANLMGFSFSINADKTFKDGDVLKLCGFEIKVIHTPGHTSGSCCFLIGNSLFTGDTLFRGDVGRTDLPTGDYSALLKSISEKLVPLDDSIEVFPGHMQSSTISRERATNPYFN